MRMEKRSNKSTSNRVRRYIYELLLVLGAVMVLGALLLAAVLTLGVFS